MDYEYDGEEPYESRVLWGRLGVYVATLLLAFVLGSCVGGRGQVPESEVTDLNQQIAELSRQNTELEQQIAAVGAAGTTDRPRISPTEETTQAPADGATEGATEGEGEGEGTTAEGESRTYEVQPGDTLTAIAQRMYGDSTKFDIIAEANDLEGQLVVGQELVIPPAN